MRKHAVTTGKTNAGSSEQPMGGQLLIQRSQVHHNSSATVKLLLNLMNFTHKTVRLSYKQDSSREAIL